LAIWMQSLEVGYRVKANPLDIAIFPDAAFYHFLVEFSERVTVRENVTTH
jgi:hypothetical protein